MTHPLVTIMIPTRNQRELVGDAVRSALAQDYPNLEVVVSDDASTDGTAQALAPLADAPRLRLFVNETNLGRVGNYRHTLTERANGEWVLNLDGDDRLTAPDFISHAVAAARTAQDVMLVCGRHAELFPDGSRRIPPVNASAPPLMSGRDFLLVLPDQRVNVLHLATLYRRETALAIGFYGMDVLSSDWESLYRLALEGSVAFIPDIAGDWRRHPGSAGLGAPLAQRIANLGIFDSVADAALRRRVLTSEEANGWRRRMLAIEARGILHTECARGGPAALVRAIAQFHAHGRGGAAMGALLSLASPTTWLKRRARRRQMEEVR
ncbi:glycosyltransferase involved in cell wall biosynthesis [Desulfobaculum xiamenense]|uniref:Glycosyltransferase involved in cell wall biosynthesis n=1 Tax=Desulfobaculum xiamenense TaxID=995050 RepID=A0A846QLF9_9BACT|nr:glycosyltransferase involved in cell wall biosynthesis [Desulfobaculum xiamenense]